MTYSFLQSRISLLVLIVLFITPAHAETIKYVSDSLTIPMRSGTTNRHKILKFLPSGTKLQVQETNEDASYLFVITPEGKEGWVETRLVMGEPSARDQIITMSSKLETMGDRISKLKKSLSENKNLIQQMEKQNNVLESQNQALRDELENLKATAARPIALSQKNKELETQISQIKNTNQKLSQENAQLNDKNIKEWFVIGAAVSMGSLFFGLIIPRIRWRKKESWGGGF